MNEYTACQTIQTFDSLCQSTMAFWRQPFDPNGRINFCLLDGFI